MQCDGTKLGAGAHKVFCLTLSVTRRGCVVGIRKIYLHCILWDVIVGIEVGQ